MSAKRPRPAIPVLVHVDNPSSGGGSGDLTTVNENTTTLKNIVGTNDSTIADTSLIGAARNLVASVGNYGSTPSTAGSTVRSFLFNLREGIGSSTSTPTATGTTVRDLLTAIKENTASGGGGGGSAADLTTVNEKTTALAEAVGPANATTGDSNLLGAVKNLRNSIGIFGTGIPASDTTVRSLLYNLRTSVGDSTASPVTTGTTVRDLLTALKTATGTTDSTNTDGDLIGRIKNLVLAVGDFNGTLPYDGLSVRSFLANIRNSIGAFNTSISINDTSVRALLYNIRTAIGSGTATPTLTGTSVRDLLTQIKENTASGGSGGSADLTTVNEKTTALAAAIGSASDSSSTVSVIGLLKSITDKY